MKRIPRIDVLLALILFALNVALTYPLFLPGDTPYRDSIEGGYAGMARFVNAHPSPWGWNPLQYCGLPTQFLYVPGLLYVVWLLPGDPVYTYKLLTATLACLGPVTFYFCFFFFTGSRLWAFLTALGYTFYSPVYGLIQAADKDRGLTYLPWRLHVYAKYGEGPHNAGLTLMPLAWIAAWRTATVGQYQEIFVLAVLMAAITLTNWIAGLALAITCLLLMVSGFGRPGFKLSRIILAGVLAYGFACFWLTPTFIHTIAFNWPADAFNYKLQNTQYVLIGWYVGGLVGLCLLLRFLKWPFWETFLALAVAAFSYPVMMHYSFGIDMIPESRRYAIEFELFLVAALGSFFQFTANGNNRVRHFCAVIAAIAFLAGGASQIRSYLTQPRAQFLPIAAEQTTEYKAAKWLADQKPQGRVLVSGGLRFRLNSWFDVAQAGGAFESGLRNRTPIHFSYHIRTGTGSNPGMDVVESVRELKALGVEYVVIHGRGSSEHYRDYKNPEKFEGVLDRVYGETDDVIYRVPFRSLAHAIHPEEEPQHAFRDSLQKYVEAIDNATRPKLKVTWIDTNRVKIDGDISAGMLISLQVSHDPGWQAKSGGKPVAVEKDTLGFIKLRATGPVELEYKGTPEQRGFAFLSVLTWAGSIGMLWKNRG
ncbi:MAG TPA: hypothetical protein VEX68_09115 [Bryobacteraceae bacterium]|nr:hypothetical protein [Bryobacteraceae bacterium]